MTDRALPWFLSFAGVEAFKRRDNYVVLDYETTMLTGFATNPDQHIVLACWYVVKDGQIKKKYKFGDEYQQGALERDLYEADFVVAHNAKFEAQWLQRSGVDIGRLLFFDTMVAEWVIVGNNPHRLTLNLDDVGERRTGERKNALGKNLISKWQVDPALTPESWLLKYCFKDVDLTHKVFLDQCTQIEALGLWHIILARNVVIPVLADIELAGLQLDADRVVEEYNRQRVIQENAAEELDKITGGINLNSRQQIGRLLYDTLGFAEARDLRGDVIKTKGGGRSTTEDVILKLVPINDVQATFLEKYKEYVKATTLLSKSLTFMLKVVQHNGGIFYGTILQGRTATHRFASGGMDMLFPGDKKTSKIQLQNIPRQYKKLFTAHDPDYVVREDDGAQLEFRVAGDLGNDAQIIFDLENGEDIHATTRQVMRDHKHPNFDGLNDKEARQEAKPFTFQPLYGGKGSHPAEHKYAEAWAKKYPGITQEQERWCMVVAANKELITPYGMRFYWPDVRMYHNGSINKRTEVFNFAVQGFATAEIIPIALTYFWHRSRHLRIEIFNTVHDSIISRVHKDDNEAVDLIAKQALTHDVYDFLREVYKYEFKVPLGVGSKSSRNWGEAKTETVWEVWPDGRERFTEKD